jgi:exodeoxyribonuclease VII small subunit
MARTAPRSETPEAALTGAEAQPNPSAGPRYEEAVAELDRLVAAMEAGQLPLDEMLEHYRRASELLALCRERLQAVEDQVKVFEDGQLRNWSPPA